MARPHYRWKRRRLLPAVVLALTALAVAPGCRTGGSLEDPLAPRGAASGDPTRAAAGARLQLSLETEAREIEAGFAKLRRSGGWVRRGYLDAEEHDALEGLLFRFVVNHSAFWGELDRWGGTELALTPEENRPRVHLLVLHAGLALAGSSAALVTGFANDPVAIAKLNEAFYRSEIPEGTYDTLQLAVTSRERRRTLAAAWSLHEKAVKDPASAISRLGKEDPAFAALLAALPALSDRAGAGLALVDEHAAGGLDGPLRHSEAADLGRDSVRALGDARYATRALVFKNVSRIKSPTAHLITFSPAQKQQLHAALRPGDLILTYTAGYVSDVFIPGAFKHGITYVGGAQERAAAGLTPASAPHQAHPQAEGFAANLVRETLSDGSKADLIEAVAEGVKFSNLDTILDTHINRLVVLRPRLDAADRTAFLAGVFAYLGDPYDFRFDFADASKQVCTEVIYRALDGRGGIRFALTKRAGVQTLSADDVVNYHLAAKPRRFDLVLYAAEDPDASDHQARIWTGAAATTLLAKQMAAEE